MSDANVEYVLHYRHGGHVWTLTVFAAGDEDAARKVASMRDSLEIKGRLLGRGDTLDEAAEAASLAEASAVLRRVLGAPVDDRSGPPNRSEPNDPKQSIEGGAKP